MVELPVNKDVHKRISSLKKGESVQLSLHLHGRPPKVEVVSGNLKPIKCAVTYPETRSERKGVKTVTTKVILEKK